jgi:FkbO/Hyg5 family chorismatase
MRFRQDGAVGSFAGIIRALATSERLRLLARPICCVAPMPSSVPFPAACSEASIFLAPRLGCVLAVDPVPPRCPDGYQALLGVVYGKEDGSPVVTEGGGLRLGVVTGDPGGDIVHEVWYGQGPLQTGQFGKVRFSHNDDFLAGAGFLPDLGMHAEATRLAYLDLFALLKEQGFPHLLRIWTLIPRINLPNADGMENYRDFCVGRAQALDSGVADAFAMPAATVVGSAGSGIVFYFLATRVAAPFLLENPRQVPACQYPAQYGPRAPLFARGALIDGEFSGSGQTILVSGTASIVGHQTVHSGDVERQCHEALDNVVHLVGAPNLHRHRLALGADLTHLKQIKVYYRHPSDLPRIRSVFAQRLGAGSHCCFIQADICRDDLLVELEALVTIAVT